jgi:hypothetical protein
VVAAILVLRTTGAWTSGDLRKSRERGPEAAGSAALRSSTWTLPGSRGARVSSLGPERHG